jgi:hypothetical protein
MDILIFGINSLGDSSMTDHSKTVRQALLASTTPEIFKVLYYNSRCMVKMCSDCRVLRTSLNKASLTDLAVVLSLRMCDDFSHKSMSLATFHH